MIKQVMVSGFLMWSVLTVYAQDMKSVVIYSGLQQATSLYATTNYLFVVESGRNRILKLDHNGTLLETLGGLGIGDYQFDQPIDIDATNGLKIYISDYRNGRIQIFDRRFQYLTSITGKSPFGERRSLKPTQLLVNDFGELFFYDEISNSIYKHDENGNYVARFEVPVGFIVSDLREYKDRLELIDLEHQRVQLLSQNGVLGESFPLDTDLQEVVDIAEQEGVTFFLYNTRIEKSVKK